MKLLKQLSTLIIFAIITNPLFSQNINPQLYKKTWQDNETRYIYGYDITKIFGQQPNNPPTYNYSQITAISYKNLDDIKKDFEKKAEEENWSDQMLRENLNYFIEKEIRGQFQLYITRYNENRANLKWFSVIVRGMDDKGKIWEYYLPYQEPENPVNNGWWNYTVIDVPVDLPDNFLVYINDKLSNFLSDYKFKFEKVNSNK